MILVIFSQEIYYLYNSIIHSNKKWFFTILNKYVNAQIKKYKKMQNIQDVVNIDISNSLIKLLYKVSVTVEGKK